MLALLWEGWVQTPGPFHLIVLWPRLITSVFSSVKLVIIAHTLIIRISLDNILKDLIHSTSVGVFIEHLLNGRHMLALGIPVNQTDPVPASWCTVSAH